MPSKSKNFLVEIKVLDEEGRKVKGLIEEMSESIQLRTVVEMGLLLQGTMKGSSLIFELHSSCMNAGAESFQLSLSP